MQEDVNAFLNNNWSNNLDGIKIKIMKKILVIEDELTIRENIAEMLEMEGFQPLEAENGKIGLELAMIEKPDLILCDVMMPEINGYEVLMQLRENANTATIPFIFLTAKADKNDFRKGMQLGADDYLTKPCTSSELLQAINTRLNKHEKLTLTYNQTIKDALEKINYLVYYDAVTSLPNRLLLSDKFNQIIRGNKEFVSIFSLRIDRLSNLKEILEQSQLELFLQFLAARLRNCLNAQDILARFSDDQFVIILANVKDEKQAQNIAENILNNIDKSFVINEDKEIFITMSMGISCYPKDGIFIDKLVQNAQKAQKQFKDNGGINKYYLYTAELHKESDEKIALEADLINALYNEELFLTYQPQVDLITGKIVGAEVLLRWQNPTKGLISPSQFIPIAEETGLIIPIGEWLLKTACKQIKYWEKAGFSLRVAVNISACQFNQTSLRQSLIEILDNTGINPENLDLELTESMLVENKELAIKQLNSLKELGLKIAIDDFGTGYSSLSYLQQFPFDILKIDQVFVRNITQDQKSLNITKSIIQMANSLNLKVIAEGVETEQELTFLRQNKCDEMQGFLFSKPLRAKDFELLLASDKCL